MSLEMTSADSAMIKKWNVGWTIGNYCNATCGHCYSWQLRRTSENFLSIKDVERIIEGLISIGTNSVNLGGNEPIFTHGSKLSDSILPVIISMLHEAKIPTGLTTNGFTFNHLARKFPKELQMINDVDFSLDSPHKKYHDQNRGAPLYESVLKGLSTARDLRINCSIIFCGMRGNFDKVTISEFLKLAHQYDSELRVNLLKPTEISLLDDMPTPQQYFEGFELLLAKSRTITQGESCITAVSGTGYSGCPCGTTSFRINAKSSDGQISLNPCVYMHDFQVGNILDEDISSVISSKKFADIRRRSEEIPKECLESSCSYVEECRGGCTARAYLVNGSLDSKDPYCPHEHFDAVKFPNFPTSFEVGVDDDSIRVHDKYLCTWIGKPDPTKFDDEMIERVGTPVRIMQRKHSQALGGQVSLKLVDEDN